jgi:hypothetical protein
LEKIEFEIVCPNAHDQTISLTEKQFEDELKAGVLEFHCNTCDKYWPPSHDNIAYFRRQFEKHTVE